jgi:hypothetical protein
MLRDSGFAAGSAARRSPSVARAARTSGQERRTQSAIGRLNRPTSATVTMLATSSPAMTAITTSEPPVGALNCRSRFASVKRRSRASRSACTIVLVKESIAPAVTAPAGVFPCRWKKWMLTASRAADEGKARFM